MYKLDVHLLCATTESFSVTLGFSLSLVLLVQRIGVLLKWVLHSDSIFSFLHTPLVYYMSNTCTVFIKIKEYETFFIVVKWFGKTYIQIMKLFIFIDMYVAIKLKKTLWRTLFFRKFSWGQLPTTNLNWNRGIFVILGKPSAMTSATGLVGDFFLF